MGLLNDIAKLRTTCNEHALPATVPLVMGWTEYDKLRYEMQVKEGTINMIFGFQLTIIGLNTPPFVPQLNPTLLYEVLDTELNK